METKDPVPDQDEEEGDSDPGIRKLEGEKFYYIFFNFNLFSSNGCPTLQCIVKNIQGGLHQRYNKKVLYYFPILSFSKTFRRPKEGGKQESKKFPKEKC